MDKKMPGYIFLIGLLLAVILGLGVTANPYVILLLSLIAIANGYLVGQKINKQLGLWIAIALGIVGVSGLATALGGIPQIGIYLANIMTNIGTFFTLIAVTIVAVICYKSFGEK